MTQLASQLTPAASSLLILCINGEVKLWVPFTLAVPPANPSVFSRTLAHEGVHRPSSSGSILVVGQYRSRSSSVDLSVVIFEGAEDTPSFGFLLVPSRCSSLRVPPLLFCRALLPALPHHFPSHVDKLRIGRLGGAVELAAFSPCQARWFSPLSAGSQAPTMVLLPGPSSRRLYSTLC